MSTCRVHPDLPTPVTDDDLANLRRLPSSVVSDQLERFGLAHGIQQVTKPKLGILAGRAFTVRTRPGDNLMIYKAVEMATEGDILVVDGGGATDRALMGEIFYQYMVSQGIGGVVIDGAIRDGAEIAEGPIPVFARAFAHTAPFKNGPRDLRGPIAVGGSVVMQGDVVVGDADSVAALPRARVHEVIAGGLGLLERGEGKTRRCCRRSDRHELGRRCAHGRVSHRTRRGRRLGHGSDALTRLRQWVRRTGGDHGPPPGIPDRARSR